jgi:hypothetical protein
MKKKIGSGSGKMRQRHSTSDLQLCLIPVPDLVTGNRMANFLKIPDSPLLGEIIC